MGMRYEVIDGQEHQVSIALAVYDKMELVDFRQFKGNFLYFEINQAVKEIQKGNYIPSLGKKESQEVFVQWKDHNQWNVVQNNTGVYFERMSGLCRYMAIEAFGYETFKHRDENVYREISQEEFKSRYPEVPTYDADISSVYLESGALLLRSEWNGECYNTRMQNGTKGMYLPLYCQSGEDEYNIVGYTDMPRDPDERFITMDDVRKFVQETYMRHNRVPAKKSPRLP